MMARPFNFAAGPGMLPQAVLARVREELVDWRGSGMSALEMPFTGPEFAEIQAGAIERLKRLLTIPVNYHVLFLQGGAYGHFAFVPLNLLRGRTRAAYVETGHWSRRAMAEARRYCSVETVASSEPDGFTRIPPRDVWRLSPDAAYCHITTNETAQGVQFHWTPETAAVPLVADMTSDLLSRPIDVARYGLIYASAQKSIGPAGLTIVIVRDDLLGEALPGTPAVFDYKRQADADSRVNTPPTFAIYVAGLVFEWLAEQGGLAAMERRNRRNSARLYAAIDAGGVYRCPVAPPDRSTTTPCFRLADESLEADFLAEARRRGLLNLQGHPAVGGVRVSLYNAMPDAGVDALIDLMATFARQRGRSAP